MISTDQYKHKMVTKMIDSFVKNLHEKTGLKAMVMLKDMKPTKDKDSIHSLISLKMFEEAFLKAYPFSYGVDLLRIKSRKNEYVEARCVFCYIAKTKLGFTYTGIGNYLNKDHTSIIHMNKRANDLLETDDKFYNLYYQTMENLMNIYDKNLTEHSVREHKS